ncbi:hypothetical protein [Erysipelothrix anatis]|uniref:hypothetical protein n=1 Tax=Erysipelothrix anatis TaxID=2683713 RepID=UPI0013583FE0|nr:hypothetical protein [Erysipelothrix anatis]
MYRIFSLFLTLDLLNIFGFVSSIIVPIITTLLTISAFYFSRRKLKITSALDDDKTYHSFYENDLSVFKFGGDDSPKLKTPKDWPNYYRILTVIITNESPKPIRIQNLLIHDRNKMIPIVDRFNFNFANNRTFTNDEVTLISSGILSGENNIWFQKVNLFNPTNILVEPYESMILNYAIDANVNTLTVDAYTTLVQNWIFKSFFIVRERCKSDLNRLFKAIKINFLINQKTTEHDYKTFSSKAKGSKIPI